MGLQDTFFQLRLCFDADAAKELSTRVQEETVRCVCRSKESPGRLDR
jgi:hypothetical protein